MSATSGDNNSPPLIEELAFLRESVGDRYLRIAIGVQSQTPTEPRTTPNTQPTQNGNTQGSRMSQRVNLDIDQFQTQNSGSHNTSNSLPTPPPDQAIPSQDAFGDLQQNHSPYGSGEFPVSLHRIPSPDLVLALTGLSVSSPRHLNSAPERSCKAEQLEFPHVPLVLQMHPCLEKDVIDLPPLIPLLALMRLPRVTTTSVQKKCASYDLVSFLVALLLPIGGYVRNVRWAAEMCPCLLTKAKEEQWNLPRR